MISSLNLRNLDEEGEDGTPGAGRKGEHFTKDELEAKVKKAREEGRIAGYLAGAEDGRNEARDTALAAQAETAEMLAKELARLAVAAQEHRAALIAQVVGFTLQTCEVVFPELIDRFSKVRVKKMVGQSLKMAIGSIRIRIRLSPATMAALEDELRQRAAYYKCDGALDLAADETMHDGEARMEWDHGRLDYGFEQICNRLLAELRQTSEKAQGARKEIGGHGQV